MTERESVGIATMGCCRRRNSESPARGDHVPGNICNIFNIRIDALASKAQNGCTFECVGRPRDSPSRARRVPSPLISLSRSAVRNVFALERDVGPDGSRHGAVLGRRRPITGLLTWRAEGERRPLSCVLSSRRRKES